MNCSAPAAKVYPEAVSERHQGSAKLSSVTSRNVRIDLKEQ